MITVVISDSSPSKQEQMQCFHVLMDCIIQNDLSDTFEAVIYSSNNTSNDENNARGNLNFPSKSVAGRDFDDCNWVECDRFRW